MLKISKKFIYILISIFLVFFIFLLLNLNSFGKRPEVHNLSSSVARPGDTITLYGNYLGDGVSKGRVFINDKMVFKDYILSWSNKEITIKLTDDFKSGMIVVNNMFGDSIPYLITSYNDVPKVNSNLYNNTLPLINDAQFIKKSDLKIGVEGVKFGTYDDISSVKIVSLTDNEFFIDSSNISKWSDGSIEFFLPFDMDNIIIQIINRTGVSNEFAFHSNEIPLVVYVVNNKKNYEINQKVQIKDIIALKNSYIDIFFPTVYSDLNQKDIEFSSNTGKYNEISKTFNYEMMVNGTGESGEFLLNTKVKVYDLEVKIRKDGNLRLYDELSPAYIQGFEPIRDVDKDFKSLKEAGIWIVRNTKNRLNQAELIIDWIIRYIKVNDESSDIASIAFDNRSASSKGLVNITVSMLRAVGIPSRVVTGIKVSDEVKSYSWLEFYLPGGGWVPYDLLEKKVDINYIMGTIKNNLIAFSKGETVVPYHTEEKANISYAVQNCTTKAEGNIESYDALWHNIEIISTRE